MITNFETTQINKQKVMRINKFCCIPLRTCGLTIAYVDLALALLFIGVFGVAYSSKSKIFDNRFYFVKI